MANEAASSWDTAAPDIFESCIELLRKEGYWRTVAPRLRLVCKRWRSLVDAFGMYVNMHKLPDFPLCRDLVRICCENSVTSLRAFPQYGRVLNLTCLLRTCSLAELRTLSVNSTANGNAVLFSLSPLFPMLRRLELRGCKMSIPCMQAISCMTALTDLRFERLELTETSSYSFTFLGALQNLQHFGVEMCDEIEDLEFLSTLTQISSLCCYVNSLRAALPEGLVQCMNLKALDTGTRRWTPDRFDVVCGLKQLTALTLLSFAEFFRLTPLTELQRLCLQSMDWVYIAKGKVTGICPRANPIFGQRSSENCAALMKCIPHMTSLTSLDIVNQAVLFSSKCWTALSALSNLRELRMNQRSVHKCTNVRFDAPLFPRLKLWTVGFACEDVMDFAARAMPVLEYFGISIERHPEPGMALSFDQLQLHPRIHTINIASLVSLKGKDWFWTRFQLALGDSQSLKHIGWRCCLSGSFSVPDETVEYFLERGVLVDSDNHIFATGL